MNDDDQFRDRIISFDFIKYELGINNNFENHPRGLDEIAWNREFRIVQRQQQAAMQPPEPAMNQSQIARLAGGFRKTIVGKMANSIWKDQECCICLIEFEHGAKVVQLACHRTHLLHDACYISYLDSQGGNALCPLCKTPIDKAGAKKIEIQEKTPKVEDDDPFANDANKAKKANDAPVISAPVAINEVEEPIDDMPVVMAPGNDDSGDLPPPQ